MERDQARPGAPPRPAIRRRASARRLALPSLGWVLEARTVAIALGVLAALGLLGATLSFVVDLFVAPWRIYSADAEESLHLVASAIGLAGASQLARGQHQAKALVLVGLALNVLATLLLSRDTLPRVETVLPLLTWLALGALTIFARVRYS